MGSAIVCVASDPSSHSSPAQNLGSDVRGQVGLVEAERQIAEVTQPLDEHHSFAGRESQPAGHRRRGGHRQGGPHLIADLAEILERLLQSEEGIEPVVVLALRDVGADLGSAVDQPLVLQDGERLANGVARHEEFGRQLVFGGQPVGVGIGVDLLAQHVGDAAGAVGPRAPDRYWLRHEVKLTRPAGEFSAGEHRPRRPIE